MPVNWYYEGKRFKNGNINIRFAQDEIKAIQDGEYSALYLLSEKLFWFDTYPIGEPGCAGNWDMMQSLYSYYSDRVFIFMFADIDKLMQGSTVKLYARVPSAEDRQLLEGK